MKLVRDDIDRKLQKSYIIYTIIYILKNNFKLFKYNNIKYKKILKIYNQRE